MQFISNLVTSLVVRIQSLRQEAGQTLVEYGLIVALISIVAIAAMGFVGDEIIVVFEDVTDGLTGAGAGEPAE